MEGALEGLTANDIFRLQMNYMGFMERWDPDTTTVIE